VDRPRVRFLDYAQGEPVRLVNACEPDFRDLVRAGLLTGARYGELRQVRREDFSQDGRTLFIGELISKTSKSRYVPMKDEGVELVAQRCRGLGAGELIFKKADGSPWLSGNQEARMKNACDAVGIVLGKGVVFSKVPLCRTF
jgi:integrase